jgi:hypothetical protein
LFGDALFDIPIIKSADHVGGSGPRVMVHGKVDRAQSAHEAMLNERDMRIAARVGEILHFHYRGHFWQVTSDSKQGVVTITIPVLLGNHKYVIKLAGLTDASVIEAGGHILERFKIPRGQLDVAAFVNARNLAVSRGNQQPPG